MHFYMPDRSYTFDYEFTAISLTPTPNPTVYSRSSSVFIRLSLQYNNVRSSSCFPLRNETNVMFSLNADRIKYHRFDSYNRPCILYTRLCPWCVLCGTNKQNQLDTLHCTCHRPIPTVNRLRDVNSFP